MAHTSQNTFEGPAAGTNVANGTSGAIAIGGGASGNQFNVANLTSGSGAISISDTRSMHGTKSLKITPTTTSGAANLQWTGVNASAFATTVYIYIASHTSGQDLVFMRTDGTSGARIGSLTRVASTGRVQLVSASNSIRWTSTQVLPLNTWVRGEIYLEVGTTTTDGKIKAAFYNGDSTTPIEASSVYSGINMGAANVTQVSYGKTYSSTMADEFFIDTPQYLTGATDFTGPAVFSTVVNAGPDQTNIEPYQLITLSGTSTGTTPDSYTWTQTAGTAVTLSGSGASRTFVAPAVPNGTTLTFSLTATTGGVTSVADTVDVVVLPHNAFKAIGGVWTGVRYNRLSS